MFNKVTHVLFDLDGLLIDSETYYEEAFANVCANYGKKFTWELKAAILGFQSKESAEKIVQALELPITSEEFLSQCQKQYEILFPKIQLMPGAKTLVEHLHNCDIPIALATSSSEDSVNLKMAKHKKFLSYFHHLTMGSTDPEVERGKPDPAIFLVCASRFPDKPKPESCLVFEDAVNGVKAACAANMQVVIVPDPRVHKSLMQDATLILESLEDIELELFGLPPYNQCACK